MKKISTAKALEYLSMNPKGKAEDVQFIGLELKNIFHRSGIFYFTDEGYVFTEQGIEEYVQHYAPMKRGFLRLG